ncbi:MAG: glycosyltransferase family 4 protein [Chloroflexota bacterium]
MKLALVSPYDFAHPGGVSEHIRHLRHECEVMGHNVSVLAPRGRKGGLETKPGFYGIGRTFSIPSNGSTARLTFDVTLYAAVKSIMRREKFDIVHVHEPLVPALPYMVLLNSPGVNVATFHAFRASSPWYTAFKPYMKLLLSRLDGRIAVSDPAREFVSQYFAGPYEIIPNGIDLGRFQGIDQLPWVRDARQRLVFVGRFNEPRKGFKYLLRAMPLIHQQYPDARLIVVGAGKPEKFAGLMDKYGVRNVDFVGMVAPEDLARYYASCDLFCAPSISRESFGIVLLEAMASGLPVVAGDHPGSASVIETGREGILVPPKDPQALALAIVRVLSDPKLRSSFAAAGPAAAAQYAWPRVAERVLDVFARSASGAIMTPRERGFA